MLDCQLNGRLGGSRGGRGLGRRASRHGIDSLRQGSHGRIAGALGIRDGIFA
jgi:hypothetical protein